MTAIHKEIQQTRFKIQQLNENAEKEEMKAKVRGFCVVFLVGVFFPLPLKESSLVFSKPFFFFFFFNLVCVDRRTLIVPKNE